MLNQTARLCRVEREWNCHMGQAIFKHALPMYNAHLWNNKYKAMNHISNMCQYNCTEQCEKALMSSMVLIY